MPVNSDESSFDAIIAGLDMEIPDSVVSVKEMADYELTMRLEAIRRRLLNEGGMIDPQTQTQRDLHSERAALLIEARLRNLI